MTLHVRTTSRVVRARDHMRQLHTLSRLCQSKTLPRLQNKAQLKQLLSSLPWKIDSIIPKALETDNAIDARVVRKMLHISGLQTDISKEAEQTWFDALQRHVAFINHVHDLDDSSLSDRNDSVFRLLESDHHPPKPLTLSELEKKMEIAQNEISEEKGEFGFDWEAYTRTKVKL